MIRRTANLLICNGKNNVTPPPLQWNGRKSKESSNRTSSVAFSEFFSTVTFDFIYPRLAVVAGARGEHPFVIAVIYLYFYDGLTTPFSIFAD